MIMKAILILIVVWVAFVILRLAGGLTHLISLGLIALVLGGLAMPSQRGQQRRRN